MAALPNDLPDSAIGIAKGGVTVLNNFPTSSLGETIGSG